MKKYEKYKDSGVEWIGQIPEHWECFQLRRFVDYNRKITYGIVQPGTFDINGRFMVRGQDYSKGWANPETVFKVSDEIEIPYSRARLKTGDILYTIVGAGVGNTAIVPEWLDGANITQTTARIAVDNKKVNSQFCFHFLNSPFAKASLEIFVKGAAQPGINLSDLKLYHFTIPPLTEQTLIANYLDHKTSQIDHLIAQKDRFIELLQEERTAIINQAVTKGLNPNVPMKDSGIEWLGEIPEHWELMRMRYLCEITTGGKDTENREEDGAYPFYVRSQTVEKISTYSFDGEAILTAGDGVGVCKVWHYVNEKFDFHQRVYMMSNFQKVLGKYLFYYLKENFGKEVMKLSAKSTVDSLRRPMFQNFLIAFGSIDEQTEIISFIESQELRIQAILNNAEKEIELLKEYKTALISEVVTGKVDVRGEVLN